MLVFRGAEARAAVLKVMVLSLRELPVVQVPRSAPGPTEAQASVFCQYAGALQSSSHARSIFACAPDVPWWLREGKAE